MHAGDVVPISKGIFFLLMFNSQNMHNKMNINCDDTERRKRERRQRGRGREREREREGGGGVQQKTLEVTK